MTTQRETRLRLWLPLLAPPPLPKHATALHAHRARGTARAATVLRPPRSNSLAGSLSRRSHHRRRRRSTRAAAACVSWLCCLLLRCCYCSRCFARRSRAQPSCCHCHSNLECPHSCCLRHHHYHEEELAATMRLGHARGSLQECSCCSLLRRQQRGLGKEEAALQSPGRRALSPAQRTRACQLLTRPAHQLRTVAAHLAWNSGSFSRDSQCDYHCRYYCHSP